MKVAHLALLYHSHQISAVIIRVKVALKFPFHLALSIVLVHHNSSATAFVCDLPPKSFVLLHIFSLSIIMRARL